MNGDLKPSGYDVDRDNQSEWLFICLFRNLILGFVFGFGLCAVE